MSVIINKERRRGRGKGRGGEVRGDSATRQAALCVTSADWTEVACFRCSVFSDWI
jgi:hypothetical protein